MRTLNVNRKSVVSILTTMLLIYWVQGISYGQGEAPTVTPGETNTSLIVSFKDSLWEFGQYVYQVQLRRKSPRGDWITKCKVVWDNPYGRKAGLYVMTVIFTDLEPGTTYEARYRDTNLRQCHDNPPAPDSWSAITEGTTHLVTPPRVEFADANLATAVRKALDLDTNGDHIELLKIPEAELGKLTTLYLEGNNISDITPLAQLTQLTKLFLVGNNISDITPLAQLTKLTALDLSNNNISDLTPLAQLTQLTKLNLGGFNGNNISDLTPLTQLTQLTELDLSDNNISDVTPLAQLTLLTELDLPENNISDVTPLAQLTLLTELDLSHNNIRDVTPLAQLTQLTWLYLRFNNISDVTPLAQLINLVYLFLSYNDISDFTPLAQLSQRTSIHADELFKGVFHPSDIELMTVSTPQPLTETTLNGGSVSLTLLPSGAAYDTSIDNIRNALTLTGIDGVTVSDVIRVSDTELKVTFGFTGNLENTTTLTISLGAEAVTGYEGRALTAAIPVYPELELGLTVTFRYPLSAATLNNNVVTLTLNARTFVSSSVDVSRAITISGISRLFARYKDRVSATVVRLELTFEGSINEDSKLIFTLGPGAIENYNGPSLAAEILVAAGETPITPEIPISVATLKFLPSPAPSPAIGEQLTLSLNIADGENVAGYQATVQFDGTALRYVSSAIGDYLPAGAFPLPAEASGNTVTLAAVSLTGESAGDGTLSTITFEVIAVKESTLTLSGVLLSDSAETASRPQVEAGLIVEPPQLKEDVNGDGVVNILDLVRVASNLGKSGENGGDVNGDGVVNILDLVLVAGAFGNAAAPSSDPRALAMLTAADVGHWLVQAGELDLTDATSREGVLFLEQLLAALTPKETALLPNYPNPFNPETWIPYRLAEDAFVTLTIYDGRGRAVRTLEIGHRISGFYEDRSQAIYWDGRNDFGEGVASGVYFYHLSAGDYSATRKMLIIK